MLKRITGISIPIVYQLQQFSQAHSICTKTLKAKQYKLPSSGNKRGV